MTLSGKQLSVAGAHLLRAVRWRAALACFVAFGAAACDAPQYGQERIITLDGYRLGVSSAADRNSWFSRHLAGQGVGGTDAAAMARQVRAIEAAAGCPVDPNSILHNPYGYSTAAVAC